jgi:hypothetical protein
MPIGYINMQRVRPTPTFGRMTWMCVTIPQATPAANEFRNQNYVEGERLVLTPRKSQVFVA